MSRFRPIVFEADSDGLDALGAALAQRCGF